MEVTKVVAHFQDGRLIKGTINGFYPQNDTLQISTIDGERLKIDINHLKAIFFVKDFEGDKVYFEKKDFEDVSIPNIRNNNKVMVIFKDKERIVGLTEKIDRDKGFFITPIDSNSNNSQIFVTPSAIESVFECDKLYEKKEKTIDFLDLINKEELKFLLNVFPKDLGITFQDLSGRPILRDKAILPYCIEIRKKFGGWFCDEVYGRIPYKEDKIVDCECWAGVRYIIVPIIIAGKTVATISAVRRRSEQFPEKKLRALARKIEVEENDFLNLYQQLPAISDQQVEDAKKQMSMLARIIGKIAHAGLRGIDEVLRKIYERPLDINRILQIIKEGSCRITGADVGCLLYIEKDKPIRSLFCEGFNKIERKEHCWATTPDKGVLKEIYETKKPLLISDTKKDLRWEENKEIRSALIVPLIHAGNVLGIVNVGSYRTNAFTEADRYLLSYLAAHAAISIDNAELFKKTDTELWKSVEEIKTLSEIGRAITSELELDVILTKIMEDALKLIKKKRGSIMVIDRITNELEVKACENLPQKLRKKRLRIGQGIIGYVAETGESYYAPILHKDEKFSHLKGQEDVKSRLAIPLKGRDKIFGVLSIDSEKEQDFRQHDIELLESLADYATIALENADLFKQKTTFLTDLEHELKAPVTGIMSHSRFIHKHFDDKSVHKDLLKVKLEDLWTECKHISLLLERAQLLDSVGQLSKSEVLLFEDVIIKCGDLLKCTAQEKKLKFAYEGIKGIPPIKVDINKFIQVVYDLMLNAIKYSNNNTTIHIIGMLKGEEFKINFLNYGIGVPQGEEKIIFEKFKRGSNAYTKDPTGTGIGLTIAKNIVEVHGGRLELTQNSDPTIFTIFLPKGHFRRLSE